MFFKVGHRGARAYEIENTLESFRRAIELGANAVEFDVRQSKDGKLVLSHDENLNRVFGKDVLISGTTLAQMKQLTGNKVLALEEALLFLHGKVEKILVELKESGYEKKVLDVIRNEKMEDRTIIVSFHEEALARVRNLSGSIEIGLIYAKFRNPLKTALKLNAQYLVPLYRFVHTKDVENAHKNNLKVIVWTINTKEEARELIAKGVDGIASDKPDILKSIAKV